KEILCRNWSASTRLTDAARRTSSQRRNGPQARRIASAASTAGDHSCKIGGGYVTHFKTGNEEKPWSWTKKATGRSTKKYESATRTAQSTTAAAVRRSSRG